MDSVAWFGVASTLAFALNWIVNLGGSIVALVLFARHRHPASLLALIGFGLPTIFGPVFTLARSFVGDRMGMRGMVALTGLNGLLSFVATLALVAAIWMALKDKPQT